MNPLRKLLGDKRGNALMIAGAALPLIIGAAGLASDTIQWALWKRQLQKAADSAAIAGVYANMVSQDVSTAVSYDLGQNNRTGYALLNPATITYPADASDYKKAVNVELKMQKSLGFSSVFMSSAPVITANASAAAVATGKYCVVSLESTNTTGISAGGTSMVDLSCGMITNSTSMDAAIAFGTSVVKATPVAAVGGLDTTDNWAAGTVLLPFTLAQPDPFASVPAPTIPSPCVAFADTPQSILSPLEGCYSSMTMKGKVTLSGTYIVTGNVDIQAGAEVSCTSCTFVLTNAIPSQTGSLTINGGARLNLVSPKTGTYKGILFYQNRLASGSTVNKINGNANSTLEGAFYFPNQQVEFSGTAGISYECLQLVARRVVFTGTSTINNNCPSDSGAGSFNGSHVRLVS
jgi:hypothetical protein